MPERPFSAADTVEHAAVTDTGLRRSTNQDSLATILAGDPEKWRTRGHLFMVADGMGAHAAGELASKMAVDAVPLMYYKMMEDSPPVAIRKSIEEANQKIHSRGQANLDFRGMGTTSSVLILLSDVALVGHVGDSRVYRLRGNCLEQLSFDHSLVWEMMHTGNQVKMELPNYIPKNVITRSLGPGEQVQVDMEGPFGLQPNDTFMLCSDGLSGQVEDDEIAAVLSLLPPAEAAQALVDLANLRGGPDNITVIVTKVRAIEPGTSLVQAAPKVNGRFRHIQIALTVLFFAMILVAGGAAVVKQLHVAVVAAAIAVLTAISLVISKLQTSPGRPFHGAAHGHRPGPHTTRAVKFDEPMVERLSRLIVQLREAASDESWTIDWAKFDAFESRARAATEKKDYQSAVKTYCQAVSFMMKQLRDQRHKRA